jgi:hypothetical protein
MGVEELWAEGMWGGSERPCSSKAMCDICCAVDASPHCCDR